MPFSSVEIAEQLAHAAIMAEHDDAGSTALDNLTALNMHDEGVFGKYV